MARDTSVDWSFALLSLDGERCSRAIPSLLTTQSSLEEPVTIASDSSSESGESNITCVMDLLDARRASGSAASQGVVGGQGSSEREYTWFTYRVEKDTVGQSGLKVSCTQHQIDK